MHIHVCPLHGRVATMPLTRLRHDVSLARTQMNKHVMEALPKLACDTVRLPGKVAAGGEPVVLETINTKRNGATKLRGYGP